MLSLAVHLVDSKIVYNIAMAQNNPDDNKPVTRGYLKEVLKRVEESLQEYSQAIAKLQKLSQGQSQSYMNTNRVAQIERQLVQMQESIQTNTQGERQEEIGQNTLEQEVRKMSARIDQLERLEKKEEYDQNTIERDLRQLERDFEEMERKIRDIEYKLQRL